MKLSSKEITITKTIFTDGNFSCDYYDLLEVMEELENTDWAGSRIVFNNNEMEKYLIEKNVICKSTRGSCYRSSKGNFIKFKEKIEKLSER